MSTCFLCVGDLDVDLVVSVARLPDADDKIPGRRICQAVGGMAANVAVGLRRLGAEARLVAAIGDDEQGAAAQRAVAGDGVDTRFLVRRNGDATFMCVVLLSPNGDRSLVRVETGAYLPKPDEVPDAAFAGIRHVHLTMGSEALARHCIARARSSGASISLDLEKADLPADPSSLADLLPAVDWLFLNRRTRGYLERALGPLVPERASCVITTDGATGCRMERGDRRTEVAGHKVSVSDTTGAGDGFAAAFLHGRLVAGLSEAAALHRANAAAALVVQRFGAQAGLPTGDELDRFLCRAGPDPVRPTPGERNA